MKTNEPANAEDSRTLRPDYRNPEALLADLWTAYEAEQGQNHFIPRFTEAEFRGRMGACLDGHHSILFDPACVDRAAEAAASVTLRFKTKPDASLPAGWIDVFRHAFDQSHISAIAWGNLVRLIYTSFSPHYGYRGEAHSRILDGMRWADPRGLMRPAELAAWRRLPETVTCYRGAIAETPMEAAQGISWSLRRDYSQAHLYRRDLGARVRSVGTEPKGRPHLITALVPKGAVLAYLGIAGDDEVLVDFERIQPDMVTQLPATNLLASAVAARMAAIQKGLLGLG